jgi:hypothetical protein
VGNVARSGVQPRQGRKKTTAPAGLPDVVRQHDAEVLGILVAQDHAAVDAGLEGQVRVRAAIDYAHVAQHDAAAQPVGVELELAGVDADVADVVAKAATIGRIAVTRLVFLKGSASD